jgi:hypothetical protein
MAALHVHTDVATTPIEDILRLPGKKFKDPGFYSYRITWKFGEICTYTIYFSRDDVCEKHVIRTHEVPERTIPAHIEEEVEWTCPQSLLKDDKETT